MSNHIFRGAATALITPMNADGSVNYEEYGRLINWQIQEGIDALIIAGTTGEGSTLSDDEHKEVTEFAAKTIAGRVPMIACTGSNDTAYGIQLSKHACENGADALLLVTPYYNKTTQAGLVKMYYEYADALTKPIILYNVPSRTGINIEPATYAKLAEHPNIAAIKEANNDIAKITETMALVGDGLTLYSGNDDQIIPLLSVGGQGVISVLSNLLPRETHDMVMAYLDGNIELAREMQLKYMPLVKALFCETNPIPVKAAMARMGHCGNHMRSPLYPMESTNEEKLISEMRAVGIDV